MLFGLLFLYGAVTLTQVWLAAREDQAQPAGAIVVMGAAQYDGTPSPVLGYRMWAIRSGLLTGVVEPWLTPSLQARCAAGRGESGLPHSDGRCGRLGCGIYAGKDIGRLISRPPGLGGPGRPSARSDPSLAIGLVQLSGKVIEHDLGYRAERATVVAVVANHGGRVLVTSEPDGIAAL